MKAKCVLSQGINQSFIRMLPNKGQLTFGYCKEHMELRNRAICIVCEREFKGDKYGDFTKVPFGVAANNDLPTKPINRMF